MAGPEAELDIERPDALLAYLERSGRIVPGEQSQLTNLRGGVSNRTVLITRPGGEAWVLKQALPKLRVEVDWFSSPERTHREAEGLRWLSRLTPAGSVPRLVFEDRDRNLLAMEAAPRPHRNWKELLLEGEVDGDLVRQFGTLLGTIHRSGSEQRDGVAKVFDDRSFFESLRLEPYHLFSAERAPAAAPFLTNLVAETRRERLTLVHGDYSPKNILVHRGRLILLDHEVIHFGDPAFDLGFALTHLLSKAHHLKGARDTFLKAAEEFWQSYLKALGEVPWLAKLEGRAARHTLACLLARACGRSPLEYLRPAARAAQRNAVLTLLITPPQRIPDLIRRFAKELP